MYFVSKFLYIYNLQSNRIKQADETTQEISSISVLNILITMQLIML